ncbi:MAG: hypothetical protein RSB32_01530 [Mucinivorans sp.]
MSFDLTRSNLFATTLYSLVLVVVFWGSGSSIVASQTAFVIPTEHYWVSETLAELIASYADVCQILSASLVFVCSLMVARLAIRNVLYLERTYMPSLLFVVISSAVYVAGKSILPLMVSFLLLRATSLFFKSYTIKHLAAGVYLLAGFYFGLAAVIYPPSIYLGLMLFAGLGTFRINNIREWIAASVGFVLAFGLLFYTMWLADYDVTHQFNLLLAEFNEHDNLGLVWRSFTIIDYTFVGVISTLFILAYVVFLRSRPKYKLRGVKAYNYLVFFMLWAVIVMLISPVRTLYLLPVVAVPLSVLIPTYFASRRSTFLSNFLYALLLLSAIAIHFVR